MKRWLFLFFALVALVLSFFFLEEKKEERSEVSFWEIDIDEIEYQPPTNFWDGEVSIFYKSSIFLKKRKGISESGNFLTIESKDLETGDTIVFEGGYNSENIFRELSVLKVKGVEPIQGEKISTSLQLNENSPKIYLKSSGKILKTIWIGKKKTGDSTRIVKEGNEILIIQANTIDRFTRGIGEFRQKQLINLKDESVVETIWEEEGKTIRLDNHPFKEKR